MTNPPCICADLFRESERDGIDRESFIVEEEQRILYGHYASCNHRSPEPVGILQAAPKTCDCTRVQITYGQWVTAHVVGCKFGLAPRRAS